METDLLSISLASVDLDASAIGTREIGANVERESSESEIALLGHFYKACVNDLTLISNQTMLLKLLIKSVEQL